VCVGINEAGRHEAALSIDHDSSRVDLAAQLRIQSGGADPAVLDEHRCV